MVAFSSPFDETAVDFLEALDVPAYKIASFENIDIPLIKKVAATGKPIIISTGMASIAELDEAVQAVRSQGNETIDFIEMYEYISSNTGNSNILQQFRICEICLMYEVGLSDHTMGIGASVAAVALGAVVIEKHFTFLRADGGVDSAFSMEPRELEALVVETERAWRSLGKLQYGATEAEKPSLEHLDDRFILGGY